MNRNNVNNKLRNERSKRVRNNRDVLTESPVIFKMILKNSMAKLQMQKMSLNDLKDSEDEPE